MCTELCTFYSLWTTIRHPQRHARGSKKRPFWGSWPKPGVKGRFASHESAGLPFASALF
jgi:hypothetical protein